MNATNPATADMLVRVLEEGMTTSKGVVEVMPSFYRTLESPAVAAYQTKQKAVIKSCSSSGGSAPALPPMAEDLVRANIDDLKSSLGAFRPMIQGRGSSAQDAACRKSNTNGHQRLEKLRKAVHKVELGKRLSGIMHLNQAESMRCLALISHNNMKGAMREFVIEHKSVLKRFRLTGTNSTMTMLKEVLGTDGVAYGPTCSSGPLGGDAEVGALMCVEDLGGMFFFTDPLDPHPHGADIQALIRMCDVHNLMHGSNPTTGAALVRVLEMGLKEPTNIPTFFTTNMNPAIKWHETNPKGSLYLQPSGLSSRLKGEKVQLATAAVCVLALVAGAYRAGAAR